MDNTYMARPGMEITEKDYVITDDIPTIGCTMIQESGMFAVPKSIGHIEVLVAMGAKVVRLNPKATETITKIHKSFRPHVDMKKAFDNFKNKLS